MRMHECMTTAAIHASENSLAPQTHRNRMLQASSERCLLVAPCRAAVAPLQRPFGISPKPWSASLATARHAVARQTIMAAVNDGDVVTPEMAWRRTERYSDREWTTYQGCWTTYSGAGTGADDVARAYCGIRCFRRAGEGGRQLRHKNLISINLGFGSPVQRPDGFWESNYTYSVEDPTYSCSTRPQPPEAGLQPHQIRRLTVATPNAYLSSPAALPPAAADAAGADARTQSKDTSGPDRSILPAGIWAYEAFFEDGMYRWSLGAVYELPSRRLKTTFLIREYDIPAAPAASLDPQNLPIPDARPAVGDPAAAADVTAGKTRSVTEVRYAADGELRTVPEGSAVKELANTAGTRLLQFPDGMWARIPEQLPAAGSSGSGDVTFTWGGLMRDALVCQEMQAKYTADTGALASLCSLAWQ